jgi:thioredoxin 1
MKNIDLDQLQEMVQNKDTFIVDFYSDTCMPCKMLSQMLDQLDEKYNLYATGKVVKVNIDHDTQRAVMTEGIRAVPTIKVFKDGEQVEIRRGVPPINEMIKIIESL